MTKSKAKNSVDPVNYEKLFFELMGVLLVLFIIILIIVLPKIREHNKEHAYDEYRYGILAEADSFDGANGRNLEFEKRLDEGWVKSNSGSGRQFYYGLASAVYYCKIGYINSAEERFDVLYNMIPNDKSVRMDLESRDVMCQRSQK